jgi:hypothetical protein
MIFDPRIVRSTIGHNTRLAVKIISLIKDTTWSCKIWIMDIPIRFSSRGYTRRYYSREIKPNWKASHNLDKN